MLDEMSHVGPTRAFGSRNRFVVGCVASDQERHEVPAFDADEPVWAIADGFVFVQDGRDDSAAAHILRAYAERGVQLAERLFGAFAAALWDEEKAVFVLVRGRLGVKPLYYCSIGDTLCFASEIKALLRHPRVPCRLNVDAVPEYVAYRYVCGRETLFQGIYELEPGSSLEWRDGRVKVARYWDFPYDSGELTDKSAAAGEVDSLLRQAVDDAIRRQRQMGILLSGGLDSSLLTVLVSRSAGHVRTWSIGIERSPLDETARAEFVAALVGARHVSQRINAGEFSAALPWTIWLNDEPLHHPNAVALWLAARGIRSDANCLMMGEGADSTFGNRVAWRLHVTAVLNRTVRRGASDVMSAFLNAAGTDRGRKMAELLVSRPEDYAIASNAFARLSDVRDLMQLTDQHEIVKRRREVWAQARGTSAVSRGLYYYQKTEMVSSFNIFGKMLRGAGIDLSLPFADTRLQDLVCRLPSSLKVGWSRTKPLLAKVAKRYLPKSVVNRPKMSFAFPVGRWFAPDGDLRGYLMLLEQSRAEQLGIFDWNVFRQVVNDHDKGVVDHGEGILWSMVNFELWVRIFLNNESPDEIHERVAALKSPSMRR